MMCIAIGPVHGAAVFLQYLNGSCYFTWYIGDMCVMAQMLSMGFYQLARLSMLCSSFLKISPGHQHKIVTKMQLRVLQIIGCCLLVCMFPIRLLGRHCLRSLCGIVDTESMLFRAQYVDVVPLQYMDKFNIVFLVVYLLWDAATVLLFVVQIFRITKIESEIEQAVRAHIVRTRHAMYRVLVNSIFYELVLLIAFILRSEITLRSRGV